MTVDDQPKRRGRPPSGGREAILDATLALLHEGGVANVTSRQVAARAGVSDASVYYHFGDRVGLLQAAYEQGMKPLIIVEDPPAENLETLLATHFAALERFFDDTLPILHAAQADLELGTRLATYVEENDLGPHRGVTSIAALIRAEQQAGRVSADADPESVALLLIDAAFSRSARRALLRPDENNERLPTPERLLASIQQLLKPPAA